MPEVQVAAVGLAERASNIRETMMEHHRTLDEIGFYTLSERRAATASRWSRLIRCEVLVTGRCNFRCPYCRRVGGPDLPASRVLRMLDRWSADRLFAVRFSGGEPMLHSELELMVAHARRRGVERIAISTNGSMPWSQYERILTAGVNDASVSLDACCAEDGDRMAGGVKGAWRKVVENIAALARRIYTTVGVVVTPEMGNSVNSIVRLAADLGVHDVRVIPSAQSDDKLRNVAVDADLLARFPILRYRIENMLAGKRVRGLLPTDACRCGLVLDDMAVMGDEHWPCIIYLREGGAPIGKLGGDERVQRVMWSATHDILVDPICARNCLDVCAHYNKALEEAQEEIT